MRPLVHSLAMRPPPERRADALLMPLLGLVLVLALAVGVAGGLADRGWWAAPVAVGTSACGVPRLAAGTHLALVGAAAGGPSAFAIPGRHAARTGEVELLVTAGAAPVFLVLSARDPVVWRFGLAPGAQLAGVVAVARHPQVVVGLPAGVPVRRLVGSGVPEDCRTPVADAVAVAKPARDQTDRLRTAVGREPDSVQLATRSEPAGAVRAVIGPTIAAAAALRRLPTDDAVGRMLPPRESGAPASP